MKTFFLKQFRKNYSKRIKPIENLDKRFIQRYQLFIRNREDPILKDHALTGDLKGFRAFWVAGDIRVVYYIMEDIAYFVDIGSHNQVY